MGRILPVPRLWWIGKYGRKMEVYSTSEISYSFDRKLGIKNNGIGLIIGKTDTDKYDKLTLYFNTVFQSLYSASFITDKDGNLAVTGKPHKCPPGTENIFARDKPEDIQRFKDNINLITENPDFKERLKEIMENDETGTIDFSDGMRKYLGIFNE